MSLTEEQRSNKEPIDYDLTSVHSVNFLPEQYAVDEVDDPPVMVLKPTIRNIDNSTGRTSKVELGIYELRNGELAEVIYTPIPDPSQKSAVLFHHGITFTREEITALGKDNYENGITQLGRFAKDGPYVSLGDPRPSIDEILDFLKNN